MHKTIELTVEIVVQRVSCPGVWLCQDGGVSLIVFALGTSYETCMLPPTFPLQFNDKLYFRKSFQDNNALSNMCCLLKDETLYCELVQWYQNCDSGECNVLAQYLGSLSDILFPPKMCCNTGVDLLMRRSKKYPGILSPKIEIATKVRIDEVWDNDHKPCDVNSHYIKTTTNCRCIPGAGPRQKAVCHSPIYHRSKCSTARSCSKSRSTSRSRSRGSSCSVGREPDKFRSAFSVPSRRQEFSVFNVNGPGELWNSDTGNGYDDDGERERQREFQSNNEDKKVLFESRYVDDDDVHTSKYEDMPMPTVSHTIYRGKPCICEICKRYHELFHSDSDAQVS